MIIPPTQGRPGAFRLKRGTKASEANVCTAANLPSLGAIDGPFQLAEYLALKVRADPHDVSGLVEVPAEGRSTDRDVWIYEHLRRLPIDLTPLVSQLLVQCTKESCPQMKADEWQYLCVAHGSGVSEECCAIDYILHTLDSATAVLNSTKNFPSRMSIPPGSLSHFPSLSRRLSRIFSHAYFHHREQFLLSESETSLYARFVALCEAYGLVGAELLIIPHAAEVDESETAEEEDNDDDAGEEDDDYDALEVARTREKEKEMGGGERTLSLDRQSGVGVKMLSREKGKGKVTEAEADVESVKEPVAQPEETSIQEEPKATSLTRPAPTSLLPKKQTDDTSDPKSSTAAAKKPGTIGRGTMGRGKQSRGTVLWPSDPADVPDVPLVPTLHGGQALERTESRESAIFIGVEEGPKAEETSAIPPAEPRTEESAVAEVAVPKDEIELLEEAGKLEVEDTVSPLPPATSAAEEVKPSSSAPISDDIVTSDTADVRSEDSPNTTDKPTESVKSVSFVEPEKPTSPSTSPKSSAKPIFPPTAATSPLNPPRSLSRSPEAKHKALSSGSPSAKGSDLSQPLSGPSGLPKLETKEASDALDAEGSKALPPDAPQPGSPVTVKVGEGQEVPV